MAAYVERRAACGASYNACASGATPCKFETRQPARPAGKATADRQFQRRVGLPHRPQKDTMAQESITRDRSFARDSLTFLDDGEPLQYDRSADCTTARALCLAV